MTARWRIAEGVAWVGDEDRIALIDTRRGADALPMHVQSPFAELWMALAPGPVAESDLLTVAAATVGEGEAAPFVRGFVESMVGVDVLEKVAR